MAKIIFLTPEINRATGIVRVVNIWANYLASKSENDVTITAKGVKNPYYNFSSKIKIKKFNFSFKRKILGILFNVIQLYRYLNSIKEENVNIIFDKSLFIEPLWILRKLKLFQKINFIYFTHSGSSAFREFYLSRVHTKHKVKIMFESFDKVVCLFDDETNYPQMVNRDKLFFISNPLSFDISTYPIEKKENIVLYLGRVRIEKGIDTLLKAWALIEDKRGWRVQIIGDGKEKKEFIKLSEELNISKEVDFIESQMDVKSFYEKSKIFVLPSIYEGMPMTILEAMACKSAVISSDTAGGVRLIEDNKTGLLFKKGDKYGLAQQIKLLIKNSALREQIVKNADNYIYKHTPKSIYHKWSDILI